MAARDPLSTLAALQCFILGRRDDESRFRPHHLDRPASVVSARGGHYEALPRHCEILRMLTHRKSYVEGTHVHCLSHKRDIETSENR